MYPKRIRFQLLEYCNLRCKMCYEWGDQGTFIDNDPLSILPVDVIKGIINEVKFQTKHYNFTGGEPLMYSHLDDVIHTIKRYNASIDIHTNGIFIPDKIDILSNLTNKDTIWVSLDGTEQINDSQRGKGTFKAIMKGLELLKGLKKEKGDNNPQIGINYVVTPENFENIEDLFLNVLDLKYIDKIIIANQFFITDEQFSLFSQFLKSFFQIGDNSYAKPRIYDQEKFNTINISNLSMQLSKIQEECDKHSINLLTLPNKIDTDSLHSYYHDWKKNLGTNTNCIFPWKYAEVSAKGDVTVCHTFYELTFGNVHKESFLEIWNNDKIKKFRHYLNQNTLPICTACCYFYIQNDKRNRLL